MANMTMDELDAYHEAGHAVVADALGFSGIHSVASDDGFSVGFTVPTSIHPLLHWNLAIVALAGATAQRVYGWEPGPGCQSDIDAATRHIVAYLGEDNADVVSGMLEKAMCVALALVDHATEAIPRIAFALGEAGGNLSVEAMGRLFLGWQ